MLHIHTYVGKVISKYESITTNLYWGFTFEVSVNDQSDVKTDYTTKHEALIPCSWVGSLVVHDLYSYMYCTYLKGGSLLLHHVF